MKKLINILPKIANVIIALGFITLVAGLVFFYTFPFNVAEFNKINIQNNPRAGEQLVYTMDFCRYVPKGTDIEVERFIFPRDKNLSSPIQLSSNPSIETLDGVVGCRTSEPVRLPIDLSAPAGEYRLLVRAEYCIEFTILRRCIMVEKYSDYFIVNKPDVPTQLGMINEQLKEINDLIESGQYSETDAISNTMPVQTPPTPEKPVVQPTPQPEPQQPQRGILESTVDLTLNTVNGLLNIVRGER